MAVVDGFFKRGSAADYAALIPKDPNTFYYVDDEKLYLGEVLLSNDETAIKMAERVSLEDAGNLFDSDNVEDAMAELVGMLPDEISVVETSDVGDILKKYTFYKGDQILVDIDIPKDIMSVSGTVVSEDGNGNSGTFLKLNLGTSVNDEKSSVYIDLVNLVNGITASKVIYKDNTSVEEALDDIYLKISDGIQASSFVWEDMSA